MIFLKHLPRHPLLALAALGVFRAAAQESAPGHNMQNMPGHDMSQMNMPGGMPAPQSSADEYLMNTGSGTAVNPQSSATPMVMTRLGTWNSMLMGTAFLVDTQQSGPRGGDKLYSPNWVMAAFEHSLGRGSAFQAEAMVSLEPLTLTNRSYPLLFQTGETAYGVPLADAQHPHNFVMALDVRYVHQLGGVLLDAYFAPVGDPALGPVPFPHRASAAELPEAPISHHLQDSTHIAFDVATLGLSWRKFKVEASGFHGAEPGENRWTIGYGAMDSYSGRLWYLPSERWAMQVSGGHLTHPEASDVGDQVRTTASVHYSRSANGATWSSSAIWGWRRNTLTSRTAQSFLVETLIPARRGNILTARFELADKDELFRPQPATERLLESQGLESFRIAVWTAGYTREVGAIGWVRCALGANVSLYRAPQAIQPWYGSHPAGVNMFIRMRLAPKL